MFHTESLFLSQGDGGPDAIWGGKVIQSIQWSQQSLKGELRGGCVRIMMTIQTVTCAIYTI